MTDISREAVERHIERIGPAPGPIEGYHASLNYDTIVMLRALSARVQELEGHISDMLEDQDCACGHDNPSDICMGHLPRYKRDVAAARLQALDEALEAVRKEQGFHPMTQDFEAVIEALKGDTQ